MNDTEYARILQSVTETVKRRLEAAPGCHDFDHTLRVLNNARAIAVSEGGADLRIVELAAIMHDVARPEEMCAKGKICHALRGADVAAEILAAQGVEDHVMIGKITRCILRHRYRGGGAKPETAEEKIIYDADKLDCIGAVGIGRAFHFAGREGARLHNTEAEAVSAGEYSREDSAYREYLVKLRHVEKGMLTAAGRRLAEERSGFMHRFFEQLNREAYGT